MYVYARVNIYIQGFYTFKSTCIDSLKNQEIYIIPTFSVNMNKITSEIIQYLYHT